MGVGARATLSFFRSLSVSALPKLLVLLLYLDIVQM
jgi:hypothetical protein